MIDPVEISRRSLVHLERLRDRRKLELQAVALIGDALCQLTGALPTMMTRPDLDHAIANLRDAIKLIESLRS